MRILFATMEIDPFLKLTSAAQYISKLPQGLQEKGYEIRILMPKFGVINERRNRLHEVVRLSGINIRVDNLERPLTIKVATIPNARLQVYFLDNEDYFKRRAALADKKGKFFEDNDERAIFFGKGVLETVKKLGWAPDVIHCHGWMTSLIPLYLETFYREDPTFATASSVYTMYEHPVDFEMKGSIAEKGKIEGMPEDAFKHYEGDSFVNFALGGVHHADYATRGHQKLTDEVEKSLEEAGKSLEFDQNGGSLQAYIDFYDDIYQNKLPNKG